MKPERKVPDTGHVASERSSPRRNHQPARRDRVAGCGSTQL